MGSGSSDSLALAPTVWNKPEKVAGWLGGWVGAFSQQEVDTLNLRESSL